MKILSSCWKPATETRDGGSVARTDRLLWYKDLGRHAVGDFSMAVVQANNLLEDGSQIESGPLVWRAAAPAPCGTFVGIYDGHGGPETSRYITEHLFANLKKQEDMSVDAIKKAISATEEGFISIVRKQWHIKPQMASVGSCCLVGVISGGMLYVANVGDSRAVLGKMEGISERLKPYKCALSTMLVLNL